jgi:hypothetical protein
MAVVVQLALLAIFMAAEAAAAEALLVRDMAAAAQVPTAFSTLYGLALAYKLTKSFYSLLVHNIQSEVFHNMHLTIKIHLIHKLRITQHARACLEKRQIFSVI